MTGLPQARAPSSEGRRPRAISSRSRTVSRMLNACSKRRSRWCTSRNWSRFMLGRMDGDVDAGAISNAYLAAAYQPDRITARPFSIRTFWCRSWVRKRSASERQQPARLCSVAATRPARVGEVHDSPRADAAAVTFADWGRLKPLANPEPGAGSSPEGVLLVRCRASQLGKGALMAAYQIPAM